MNTVTDSIMETTTASTILTIATDPAFSLLLLLLPLFGVVAALSVAVPLLTVPLFPTIVTVAMIGTELGGGTAVVVVGNVGRGVVVTTGVVVDGAVVVSVKNVVGAGESGDTSSGIDTIGFAVGVSVGRSSNVIGTGGMAGARTGAFVVFPFSFSLPTGTDTGDMVNVVVEAGTDTGDRVNVADGLSFPSESLLLRLKVGLEVGAVVGCFFCREDTSTSPSSP